MNDYRLRLSLLIRMCAALGVLATLSIVVTLVVALLGGALGVVAWEWIGTGLELVGRFPGISDATAVSPPAATLVAAVGLITVVNWWPLITRYTPVEYLFRPTSSSLAVTGWVLGCLYLLVVEGSAAATWAIAEALSPIERVLLGFGLSGLLVTVLLVVESRREIRRLQDQLVADSVPAAAANPGLETTVRRLAKLASVPEPDVYSSH